MSSSSNEASLAGTRFGAGVAIIALIGVVGPIVIWRASRTARNQAINALDGGEAGTFGYVDRGLWAGSNTRIFRRIRAPILNREPKLTTTALVFDHEKPQPSLESVSWVQFGSLLQSYSIALRYGDTLDIDLKAERALLPVQKSWILVLGLVGRYGLWNDKGRVSLVVNVASKQAQPGIRFTSPQTRNKMLDTIGDIELRVRPHTTQRRARDRSELPISLHGLTGTFLFSSPNEYRRPRDARHSQRISFLRHSSPRTGDLEPDLVGVAHLFWLAVGCLPGPADQVFCLEDVQTVRMKRVPKPVPISHPLRFHDYPDSETTSDINGSDSSDSSFARLIRIPSDQRNSSSSSGSRDNDMGKGLPKINNHYIERQESTLPVKDLHSRKTDVRAVHLTQFNTRILNLQSLASVVEAENSETKVYSLKEMELMDNDRDQLTTDSSGTYLPPMSKWVQLGRDHDVRRRRKLDPWFIKRHDAQQLAQALLLLPLSPYGYLLAKHGSYCRSMLANAKNSLPQLLVRLITGISALKLENLVADRLVAQMTNLYKALRPLKTTRTLYRAIFDLDGELAAAIPRQKHLAGEAVGIVMITNSEFRSLIAQSARHLEASCAGGITWDTTRKTLDIPSTMRFVYSFPVDLDLLYGDPLSNVVDIPYAEVVLMCTKAALRSAVIDTALDSATLFDATSKMPDTVYMD